MTEAPQANDQATAAESASEPPPAGDAGRAATWFVIKLVILALLLGFGEKLMHSRNMGRSLQDPVAAIAYELAKLFEDKISRSQNIIVSGGMTLVVSLECTALFAKGLFCAAALAYPARWRDRLIGCVFGVIGVGILNILRIAGLVLISQWRPDFFHFAHLVLMQWFLISCVAPLWLAWGVWATRRAKRASG